jgi:uncharacterized OsmC-like protein
MSLRERQEPLKAGYRERPESALITLVATASGEDDAASCSIDIGRAIHEAQAHLGVGGAGTAACSGDLLLGALAACAQITCQMVAASQGLAVDGVRVTVEGDLDLRGTLGVSRDAPVGFAAIRLRFDIDAPTLTERQRRSLATLTERYCTVMQTLVRPPAIETTWA